MWQSCDRPPVPFVRVEIRDPNGRLYLGFYSGHQCWLETDGHNVIKNPSMWRYINGDSALEREYKFKIQERNTTKG